jgi:hypothetical protein
MNTLVKKSISRFGLTFLVLLMGFILESGCSTSNPAPDAPDPLAGWSYSHNDSINSNKAILDDCKSYIYTLSPDEQRSAGPILYYEDGTGQHAVKIFIGINNTVWEHVLIYNKDNKRIKTIKYSNGGYRS